MKSKLWSTYHNIHISVGSKYCYIFIGLLSYNSLQKLELIGYKFYFMWMFAAAIYEM
jgi:hypothetical protein